jgi:ATP-dependent DNA helicase RecG
MAEDGGGFIVKLFKDRFSEEELQKLGLNARQIKAVLYVKEKGKVTNSEYQEINGISKRTATSELTELEEAYKIFKNIGAGAGSYYEIIGQ